MKKGFIISLGVLILNLAFPVHTKAIIMLPIDTISYYIKADTSGVNVGYLRVDTMDTHKVLVDSVKGDYALWTFVKLPSYLFPGSISDYYIINKKTGIALAFNAPSTDVEAIISSGSALDKWYDLFDVEGEPDLFLSYEAALKYYLTYDDDGVKISPESSTLTRLEFIIERPRFSPEADAYYRIKIDFEGDNYFLSADTMTLTRDSLTLDTARNDLTLWRFDMDTLINDTAIYKIRNKVTDVLLAFDKPSNDTVAYVNDNGALFQWLTPFYTEEKRMAQLMVRDTSTLLNYFLSVDADTVVMLVGEASTLPKLSFYIDDEHLPPPPIQYQFDSTLVYRIKYISGANEGKYLGVNYEGLTIFIEDSVYAHIPDGQFIVNRRNTYSLLNRTQTDRYTDTMYYAIGTSGDTIPNVFVYRTDSIEVKPILFGGFDKTNSTLGYKYVNPTSLEEYCHYFYYANTDSLEGRLLGVDTDVKLLMPEDTVRAKFLIEEARVIRGATEIGEIAELRKYQYRLRYAEDTTLYLSGTTPLQTTNVRTDAGLYYLKESINPGQYYFILYEPTIHKLIVDSVSLQMIHAPKDTTVNSLFRIEQTIRPSYDDADLYTYLTQFPDTKGKGYYELRITDPRSLQQKWLTKNFYDYAVLGREGETMLRAGSFTPLDLQLWVDTARGPHNQPDRPSFYIVKDVDTTATGFDSYQIQGYFLHVIDSTLNPANRANMVEVDGKAYNRLNYINATRTTANELQLSATRTISGTAINEYRFYFQHTDEAGMYYLMTEAGYGDIGHTNARGYLSIKNDTIYVGPRDGALKIQFEGSTVANVIIPAAPKEEISREITVTGNTGRIDILNAVGQPVYVYNMLGRLMEQRTLASDRETIPVIRGIHIVKVGPVTRKVIVQ